MSQSTPLDEPSKVRWHRVKLSGAEAAPPHAALKVTGIDAAGGAVTVAKPDADGLGPSVVLFNGDAQLDAGKEGFATWDAPFTALYDTADGTPLAGDSWGTGSGSWKLRKNKRGFVAWGGAAGERAVFVTAIPARVICVNGQPILQYDHQGA